MSNDLFIRDLAQSRINELYEVAEASRLARQARRARLARNGHREDGMASLPQLFASLRRGAARVTTRSNSHPTTQCC